MAIKISEDSTVLGTYMYRLDLYDKLGRTKVTIIIHELT